MYCVTYAKWVTDDPAFGFYWVDSCSHFTDELTARAVMTTLLDDCYIKDLKLWVEVE